MEIRTYLSIMGSLSYNYEEKIAGKTLAGYIAECYDRDGIKIPNFQKLNRINGKEIRTVLEKLGFYSSLQYGSWGNYPALLLSVALFQPRWILDPSILQIRSPKDLKPIEYSKKDANGNTTKHKCHDPLIALALGIEEQNVSIDGLIVKSSELISWTTHKVFSVTRSLQRNNGKLRGDPIVTIDRYIPKQSVRTVNKEARFLVKGGDLKRESHDPLLGFFVDGNLPGVIALEISNYSHVVQLSIEYNPKIRDRIAGSYSKELNRYKEASLTARIYDRLKNEKKIVQIGSVRTKGGSIQYRIEKDLPDQDVTILLSRLGMLARSNHWDTIKNISLDSMLLYQDFWSRKGLDCIVLNNTVRFPVKSNPVLSSSVVQHTKPRLKDPASVRSDKSKHR